MADLQRTSEPQSDHPSSKQSGAAQGKFAGRRPAFYHCATPPTEVLMRHSTQYTDRPCWRQSSSKMQRLQNTLKRFTFCCRRRPIMLSTPLKAPDATNKMLVVSIATVSPRVRRVLRSGTLTTVPSSSFNMPCCTPHNTSPVLHTDYLTSLCAKPQRQHEPENRTPQKSGMYG